MADFDYRELLGYQRKTPMRFSQFIENFMENPDGMLKTSAAIILEAIKHFGYEIVVRSGEPILRYKVFHDLFSNGINAVYGQEKCIKRIIDVIESIDKEAGPKRGVVMVGPPASGKTNICDLISQALEQYTKESSVKLHTFIWKLTNESGRELEFRSALMPNPLLLFPITLQKKDGTISRPRQQLFEQVQKLHRRNLRIPSYFRYATLDKRSLDIMVTLMQNSRNQEKTLFEILEEYIRIEEIEFSNSQGKGIANIDDMSHLKVYVRPFTLAAEDLSLLHEHLQGKFMFKYEGSLLSSNRGLLHIHDAFGFSGTDRPSETDYKPLLMLLGSGKITLESTQASLDNTVIMTTNLEEMEGLDRQLTSSKLLDRIERVPVNYLLDAISEMDILKRDMANMFEKYVIDPNLFRMAAYYSVMTRLLPPARKEFPERWAEEKCSLYNTIPPEKKLFIYADQAEDPVSTIRKLQPWHPFRNECFRLGINIFNDRELRKHLVKHPGTIQLEDCGLFTNDELKLIDDEFMRALRDEHYPEEGKYGLSIRQLQNIMRNTIVNSDGLKVTVNIFLNQLKTLFAEGPSVHHWLEINSSIKKPEKIDARNIGDMEFDENEGNYSDYKGLIKVIEAIYFTMLKKEITVATVDRDPEKIEADLRKYIQHALLDKALENKAFSHIIVPKYTYVDVNSGQKVDSPDYEFMKSIEKILAPDEETATCRIEMANKYLYLLDKGDLNGNRNKPVVNSKGDNLLACFSNEYTMLLSHRRTVDGISHDQLRDAFFHKGNDNDRYSKYSEEIRDFVESIISNMVHRFGYSADIALDTIIFALRKNIIEFKNIIS